MLLNTKEQKLIIHNMQLDYITFGQGKKALILIQGLNTNGIKGAAFGLAFMYRMFAKEYTVYLFDRRPKVFEGITVRHMAEDVALAMDALGLTKADIIGVSQGGMIAQYLAINRPDLVNKLVLAVTLSRNNELVKSVIHEWVYLSKENKISQLVEDMAIRMYSEKYMKKYKPLLPLLTLLQKPKDVPRFEILAKSCLTCDTYHMLDQIRCPVLVIGARQDKIVGGESSEEIAEKLGCECYMYETLGHAAYEEAKDFNQRMYEFLNR